MTYKEAEARRQQMIELRESGMTYDKIGEAIGLSRQRVYQLIGGKDAPSGYKPQECVYDGIRKWMDDNKITTTRLVRMMYDGICEPPTYNKVRAMLNGVNCRKSVIDRLLKATGLTYEQAFGGVRSE